MRNIFIILGLGIAFTGCRQPEPIFPKEDNNLQDIWVGLPGVKDARFIWCTAPPKTPLI